MSLLKIDKTKGKEFVLDSITMENIPKLPECQSFYGIYPFLIRLRTYPTSITLSFLIYFIESKFYDFMKI